MTATALVRRLPDSVSEGGVCPSRSVVLALPSCMDSAYQCYLSQRQSVSLVTTRTTRSQNWSGVYVVFVGRIRREPEPMLANDPILVRAGVVWIAIDGEESLMEYWSCITKTGGSCLKTLPSFPRSQGLGIGHTLVGYAESQGRAKPAEANMVLSCE